MPTSTVKEVPGPPQSRKPDSNRLALRRAIRLLLCVSLCFAGFVVARGQTAKVQINVTSVSPARLHIETELSQAINTLSFRNAYAGIIGLAERIEDVAARDAGGRTIAMRKLASGEFRSEGKFSRLRNSPATSFLMDIDAPLASVASSLSIRSPKPRMPA